MAISHLWAALCPLFGIGYCLLLRGSNCTLGHVICQPHRSCQLFGWSFIRGFTVTIPHPELEIFALILFFKGHTH